MKPPLASQTLVTEGLSVCLWLEREFRPEGNILIQSALSGVKGTATGLCSHRGGQTLGDGLHLCLGHHCSKDKGWLKCTLGKRPIDLDVKRVKGSDSG